MARMVNIDSTNDDIFYRYKMPLLQAKIEGKGNGIKTVVTNMPELAQALRRPPEYVTKFLGVELGAQTIMNAEAGRYIVNGAHDTQRLRDLLCRFINKYVLCEACRNPETALSQDSKGIISAQCAACGAKYAVDMKHKVITYMLKNPTNGAAKPVSRGKSVGDKADWRSATDEEAGKAADQSDPAAKPLVVGGVAVPSVSSDAYADDGHVQWSVDTSAEAVRQRRNELAGTGKSVQQLMADDDIDALSEAQRAQRFFAYARDGIRGVAALSVKALAAEADRLGVRDKAAGILVELLFDAHILEAGQVNKHRRLLLEFAHERPRAQRYLLNALERFIGVANRQLIPKTGNIMKALYDADIVDEEVFLAWDEQPTSKYVDQAIFDALRSAAKSFLTWLREAEVEVSDEEQDEKPSNASAAVPETPAVATAPDAAPPGAQQAIDIDAI